MNKQFCISSKLIWFFTIFSILTILEALSFNLFNNKTVFLSIGLSTGLYVWLIVFEDILSRTVYNKTFWLISLFILPYFTIIVYLFRRNKLIAFGKKNN
ncbi:MAG: hypothetical protein L3J74_03975 [Bacteroidales bacterium]|nr:hypothetical protein [Bacteroidales bacterium]